MDTKNLMIFGAILISALLFTSFMQSNNLTLAGGATKVSPDAVSRLTGTLAVSSDPSGALVYIDNVYSGVTPLQKKISAGTHTLRLELEGYSTYSIPVTILSKETKTLTITLTAIPLCIDERCLFNCTDQCVLGETICYNPSYKRICGNYDTDPCTEWSGAIACPDLVCYNPLCTGGLCSLSYVAAGLTDTGCSGDTGCTGGSCACNGLGSCTSQPVCTPLTCTQLSKSCGTWSDGCGGYISCGTCPTGTFCTNGACCATTSQGTLMCMQ